MSQYLFKAKTKEGFYVKFLSELLSSMVKHPIFTLRPEGIFLRSTDEGCEILLDIEMPRESFTTYRCPEEPIYFTLNSSHFYKLLKPIRKKDSISLFISNQHPMELGISIEQGNEKNSDSTFININYVQPEIIDLVEGYGDPVIVTSKNFQKLKTLHTIGNEMKVTVFNKFLKFYVNGKNLFSREINIGELDDDEKNDDEENVYVRTYSTHLITQLTKCSDQGGNVQIYNSEDLPMKIKMRTGNLGILTVYIKSKELIEQSESAGDESMENYGE